MMEFKFEKGINLRMQQLLDQPEAVGIVLFGSMKLDGKTQPVLVVHEKIPNKEQFMDEFYALLGRHGVRING